MIKELLEIDFSVIPGKHKMQAHSLATFSSTCRLPFQRNHQYIADVRHRPVIFDNMKH